MEKEGNKKMEPKFKKGELVEFSHLGKKLAGKVRIIDFIPGEGFRYDVMVDNDKVLYKHIFESNLKKK